MNHRRWFHQETRASSSTPRVSVGALRFNDLFEPVSLIVFSADSFWVRTGSRPKIFIIRNSIYIFPISFYEVKETWLL